MITSYTITDTWQSITTIGQSGTCWMVEFDDLDGNVGSADVVIYHTSGNAPTGDEKISESKRLHEPHANDNVLYLGADGSIDIFYARCKTPKSIAKINVDVI